MKRGKDPPDGLIDLVVREAKRQPRPTNPTIRKAVERQFGIAVSDRSIARYCAAAGVPTSSRLVLGGTATKLALSERSEGEDPAQAELSGHWPGMRRAADEARSLLGSPTSQLLGFPWSYPANGALELVSSGDDLDIRLAWEQRPLPSALREHLPRDEAWRHLAEWKGRVAGFTQRLAGLIEWVGQQPELAHIDWVHFDGASITSGDLVKEAGITHWFARTVVLAAVEDSGLGVNAPKGWDFSPRNNLVTCWVLNWTYYSSFVSVAAAGSQEELQSISDVHAVLRQRLANTPAVSALGPMTREVAEARRRLNGRLEEVAHLAVFPRRCSLYPLASINAVGSVHTGARRRWPEAPRASPRRLS